jgi:hypothetical protein
MSHTNGWSNGQNKYCRAQAANGKAMASANRLRSADAAEVHRFCRGAIVAGGNILNFSRADYD